MGNGLNMKIIGGSASSVLIDRLAELSGFELIRSEIKRFPDGECYVKINEDLKDEDIQL